ncbi:MAG: dihydrofolate reductase [Cyclobacteriaceae bacterium]
MKKLISLIALALLVACTPQKEQVNNTNENKDSFKYFTEEFADLKILRYQIPGFEKLSLDQKKLVYYLTQAGLSGRDILWDQNYRHNLVIRKALEKIIKDISINEPSGVWEELITYFKRLRFAKGQEWQDFITYTKRIWFSNGIHHHYGNQKFTPEFSQDYFASLLSATDTELSADAISAIFDPEVDAKKVNLDPNNGLLLGSATNFYAPDISADEVDAYYSSMIDPSIEEPISYGLNSKLIRDASGNLKEELWKVGGMYGDALQEVVKWLELAKGVAENESQRKGFELLIGYYKTGDLKTWDEYNIVWAATKEGDIDYIQGFVEVYNDPKAYRGSYESIVQITNFDASARMAVLEENVQWFEDNSTIMHEHKKESVKGVSYKVVTVAGESGDASPSTPIGVNLPNANWIRAKHGSKSVSLGNITEAYAQAGGGGLLKEFAHDQEEIDRAAKHKRLGDKMHTALHEVVGHASGKLNPGVGTPRETLKNYRSSLEEGRADLVALYYLLDPKLVELGLVESLEVGKEEYDGYILNGLMLQLRRIELGDNIEEAHMRNRQMVSAWAYEKGKADNVIEKVTREGKTYFNINDYDKLRALFGQLLREVQRIKSEGDYEAGRNLIENYGVKVDQDIHREVLERSSSVKSAPYGGFINPVLIPKTNDSGEIIDVEVSYPNDFTKQMLEYGEKYSFLN